MGHVSSHFSLALVQVLFAEGDAESTKCFSRSLPLSQHLSSTIRKQAGFGDCCSAAGEPGNTEDAQRISHRGLVCCNIPGYPQNL